MKIYNKKRTIILIILIFIAFICLCNIILSKSDTNVSVEKSNEELIYEIAQEYISNKNYYRALNELKNIPDYKDSPNLIKEMNYLVGKEKYNEGNISGALIFFNKVQNYKESQEYIKKCNVIIELIGTYCIDNKYIMINYDGIIYITMDNGYIEQLAYTINFDKNTINIDEKESKINYDTDFSSLIYENKTYIKESNYIDESKIKYYAPRLGMTQDEVLNTSWGNPQGIDNGGTWADKNNKKRTEEEWDESWYYKRNGNIIFIEFKKGKVVNFLVSFNGKLNGKNLSNVDDL